LNSGKPKKFFQK